MCGVRARSSMASVDSLALVSKIMLDQRFLELKRENERLKLSLFWVDHSINTLKHLTNYANNRAGGPRCFCRCCVRAKRYRPSILDGYDDEDSIVERACRFGPWFEKMLQEHGLSFASMDKDKELCPIAIDRECYPMPDASVHFVQFLSARQPVTSWVAWVYGANLWKAQTTQDPALVQLSALFRALRAGPRSESDS